MQLNTRDGRRGILRAGFCQASFVVLGLALVPPTWAQCPSAPCSQHSQCNDGKFCTFDQCVGSNCFCLHNDNQCDDGTFCDGENYCNAATDSCAEFGPLQCDSPEFCSEIFEDCVECETDAQCLTAPRLRCDSTGQCVQCDSPSQCQNGNYCDGFETCNNSTGLCEPGTPPSCPKTCFLGSNHGNTCTIDANCPGGRCLGFCSPNKADCVQCDSAAPRVCIGGPNEGQACTNDGFCAPGTCGASCQDPNYCNGVEQCVGSTCQAGTPPVCKTCVGGTNNGRGCATGDECPGGGTCTGPAGFCDEANNRCQECLTDAQCDDGLFCTRDDCTLLGSVRLCNNAPDDTFCNDGLVCNGAETCNLALTGCSAGTPPTCGKTCFRGSNAFTCAGGANNGQPCTPGSSDCTGGSCNPTVCTTDAQCGKTCLGSSPPVSCTTDSNCLKVCEGGLADGEPCCLGSHCPGGQCLPGICVPGICQGLCSETFGGCSQCDTNANCSDSLFCDGTETCVGPGPGQCAAGTPPNCEASGTCECTQGTCNEATDQCGAIPINNGGSCSDGNHCTAASECSNGACIDDPPAANDPWRCVRLEWRPTGQQTLKVGSTQVLSLYAVADGCNTPSCDCATTAAAIAGIEALLAWTPSYLQLQPSIPQNRNPADPCDNPNNPCAVCNGVCNGGTRNGLTCDNVNTLCPLICTGGSNAGGACLCDADCRVCSAGPRIGTECVNNLGCGECIGGGNAGASCDQNNDCASNDCSEGSCGPPGTCNGKGCDPSPATYNWISSLFPNDCSTTQINGPCPSTGFPGNDGDALYNALIPNACGLEQAGAACATSAGLHVTDFKFKALAIPPTGGGVTTVAINPCGSTKKTIVTTLTDLPLGANTSDILKAIGPAASIHVVACTAPADCDDGDFCTVDGCVNNTCQHTLNLCPDPDPCTFDYCQAGTCHHDPICQSPEVCYQGVCYDPCSTPAQCDDGVGCTVDTCDPAPPPPIDGICRHAPDDAFCDTGLFCSAKICDPNTLGTGCVFDHACFNPPGNPGNPCPSDPSCDEATDTCGGCLVPSAAGMGARYVGVTPANQGATPIALLLKGICEDADTTCVNRYVQSKCIGGPNNGQNCASDADCPRTCAGGTNNGQTCVTDAQCPFATCAGKCDAGTLGATPFYKTSAQWGTAMLRGSQIRPSKEYSFLTECNFGAGQVVQSAAVRATTWKWGDVDGDGDADALDVAQAVNKFKSLPGAPPFHQVNMWGCTPDPGPLVDALDISSVVDAVKGFPFPCSLVCP